MLMFLKSNECKASGRLEIRYEFKNGSEEQKNNRFNDNLFRKEVNGSRK